MCVFVASTFLKEKKQTNSHLSYDIFVLSLELNTLYSELLPTNNAEFNKILFKHVEFRILTFSCINSMQEIYI